jgi:hypothetical protein
MEKVNSIMQETLFYWVQSAQSHAQIYLETFYDQNTLTNDDQ